METLEIGCSPSEEDCTQVGASDYREKARKECQAFISQLIRTFGEPPEGCRLFIKSNPHDFGSYLEVAAKFNPDSEEATNYAYRCESEAPPHWDDEARKELGLVPVASPDAPLSLYSPPISGIRFDLKGENPIEDSIVWGTWHPALEWWRNDENGRYFVPQHLSGSDYSGSLIERSNVDEWKEEFGEGRNIWWTDTFGGHGTFGIVIDLHWLSDEEAKGAHEARDFLERLSDYPSINDDRLSRMELDAQSDNWESWAKRDFIRALEHREDFNPNGEIEVPDDSGSLYDVFCDVSDRIGEYWVNEQGESMHINVDKIAKAVTAEEFQRILKGE